MSPEVGSSPRAIERTMIVRVWSAGDAGLTHDDAAAKTARSFCSTRVDWNRLNTHPANNTQFLSG